MAPKVIGAVSCSGARDGGGQLNSYRFYARAPRLRIVSPYHPTPVLTTTPLTEQAREPLADSTAGVRYYTILVSRRTPDVRPKATWAGGEANIVYKSGIGRWAWPLSCLLVF